MNYKKTLFLVVLFLFMYVAGAGASKIVDVFSSSNFMKNETENLGLGFWTEGTAPTVNVSAEELKEDIRRLSCEEKQARGIQTLPENLGRALDAMYQDSLIMEVLGEPYVSVYGKAKRKEWKSYLAQVTEWEISQYLYML